MAGPIQAGSLVGNPARSVGSEQHAPPFWLPAAQKIAAPVLNGWAEPPAPVAARLPEATGRTLARTPSIDGSLDPTAFPRWRGEGIPYHR
jgi:hypothetical protein